jgi:hypothetical protein
MYKKNKHSEFKVLSWDNLQSPEQIIKLHHSPLSRACQPNMGYGRQARQKAIAEIKTAIETG